MPDTEKEALCARIDELCAEVERLRQENQSIGMAAYEVGYKDGSVHYELDHCPACKNVADLQAALAENTKLRKLIADIHALDDLRYIPLWSLDEYGVRMADIERRMRELGVEDE